jgi:hypothetical protein
VLAKIQTDFRGASDWDKQSACANLWVLPMAIMAWDVLDLFLPHTGWINNTVGCATPQGASGVEDSAGCTNSVWAGGHCHLAGTANYGMFGIVMKLCSDYRATKPWYTRELVNPWSEGGVRNLIGAWKTIDPDDAGPPTNWALATYRGGPSARPAAGNRDGCSHCGGPATTRVFDYSWSPIHGSLLH